MRTRHKETDIKATAAAAAADDDDKRNVDCEILVTGTQKNISASLLYCLPIQHAY